MADPPRRRASGAEPSLAPPVVHDVLRAPGVPLDAATETSMSAHFDHEFSEVRVHADARAAESAEAVGARAYTVGPHVVFGAGQYRPGTADGRGLLAHELTHVVQQRDVLGTPAELPVGSAAHATEQEAGDIAAASRSAAVSTRTGPVLRRSALTDELTAAMAAGGRDGVFALLRKRRPGTPDPDLTPWLDRNFPAGTHDREYADLLVAHGPEPRWPADALVELDRLGIATEEAAAEFDVGAGRTPVRAYYFPGLLARHAMIVGGMHGSERAGVEVVELLLELLRTPDPRTGRPRMPTFSVIVVPTLLPANYAKSRRKTPGHGDPNRQSPAIGTSAGDRRDAQGRPLDTVGKGRPIEPELLVLYDLVDRFQPERIAMVHGVTGGPNAGVSTDPRPGREVEDKALAQRMGVAAGKGGARVPLNDRGDPTYPTNEVYHEEGVSFGAYGQHATNARPAMNVVLIETLTNARSDELTGKAAGRRKVELESFATVLRDIFLEQD